MDVLSVALLSYEFPPYVLGGVASYTHDLARLLSERKIRTTVFCGQSPRVFEEHVNENLTVVRLPILEVPPRFYWFQIINYPFLRTRLHEFNVVHAVDPQTSAVCALIRRPPEQLVTTVHNVPIYRAKTFFNSPCSEWNMNGLVSHFVDMSVGNRLCSLCFNKSQKIVFVGESVRQEAKIVFGDALADKATVIPNGISLTDYQSEPPWKCDETDRVPFLLFFGRLVPGKGIPLLLRAWTHIQRHHSKVRLVIVGGGPLLHPLRALSCELGLSGTVEIDGYIPRSNLITVIKRSLAVVLPSSYEGASFALLEAMACNKPVIALDYPFSREVITNYKSGLLATPGDELDLARKIQLVIEDEDLRVKLGRNALERVRQKYNWDKLIDRYITLYQSVANADYRVA
ncbi:MAG TPA: glycosyltransferase family 4 protein [Terriglobales bacterium]|nr:glycosyltransferase family 4 protein [Terriglobales bacterium]